MNQKKEIEAIYELEIKPLLNNLGFLDDFMEGKITCRFCEDKVREDNFGAVFSKNKEILFSCSKIECLANLTE